ncbi:hypothetical protein GCM10007103_04630 [Salinimicrobium marinum]|uniref:Tissue inhibitor of metalloproteinase n=1 Tax=Salinimicrobium marinum TaxID=680283 RepID=A0A918VVC8_9FLAO|nr:hypothetical protein [Salinimicrobium marinum]GHA26344.1 hypothetical protein GCM10007103_04630 [Salinimicrobium marinum]
MVTKQILILILLLSSTKTFACECVNVVDNSFLGKTKSFDFIVKGEIDQVAPESVTMTVEEVYKGSIKENTIQLLRGGPDCMHSLDFKPGDKLIIGLVNAYYEQYPNAYMVPGCITSVIYVKGQKAYTPELQPHMFKKPKITMFESTIRLEVLERMIRRKVGS